MAWVYLDDGFPDHPKVLRAGSEAAWLFVCGLAYVRRLGTDGLIPKAQVPRLTDRAKVGHLAERLVDVGLWEDVGGDFRIHDFDDWNRPQASRSEAGRKAANARWAKRDADSSHCDSDANASADAMRTQCDDVMPHDALSLSLPVPLVSVPSVPLAAEPPQKPSRADRDALFEALVDVCGYRGRPTKAEAARIATAAASLADVGATAGEIRRRAAIYRGTLRDAPLTPTALAANWNLCAAPKKRETAVDRLRMVSAPAFSDAIDVEAR